MKYKYSRKDWIAKHLGDYNLMSHYEKELADSLLATVPTKECELCLEDSGNHTFDCPRHKRNLNPTPPQLPKVKLIEKYKTETTKMITEKDWISLENKINQVVDRVNLLSQRVCKEK